MYINVEKRSKTQAKPAPTPKSDAFSCRLTKTLYKETKWTLAKNNL